MIVLSATDIEQLAALQTNLLDTSLVSRFGYSYAKRFWKYVDAANTESVVCIRDENGNIVAACLLSFAPKTLSRRLAIYTPLAFFALQKIYAPWLWQTVYSELATRHGPINYSSDAAEVVMLMTHPTHRRQGCARQLLAEVEGLVAARGLQCYYVRTSERMFEAVAFYESQGFINAGYLRDHGATFKLMKKMLTTSQSQRRAGNG